MGVQEELRSLTFEERRVLWWKCQGLEYREIGSNLEDEKSLGKVPYGHVRITQYMSRVYEKFGLHDRELHHRRRWEILDAEYCDDVLRLWPTVASLEQDLPPIEKGFILVETEDGEEELVEIEIEPEPDPRILAMVLIDEEDEGRARKKRKKLDNGEEPIIIPDPPNGGRRPPLLPPPRPRRRWPAYVFIAVIVFLVIAVIYLLDRDSLQPPEEIGIVITATVAPVTDTPLTNTADVAQVQTDTAATVIAQIASVEPSRTDTPTTTPTFTPTSIDTPTSTPTPSITASPRNVSSIMRQLTVGK